MVLHHIQQRNLATLAGILPQLKEWFDLAINPHVIALKPYFYLLNTLHMTLSGDFTARKQITSFHSLIEPWNTSPEASEFQFKVWRYQLG